MVGRFDVVRKSGLYIQGVALDSEHKKKRNTQDEPSYSALVEGKRSEQLTSSHQAKGKTSSNITETRVLCDLCDTILTIVTTELGHPLSTTII